MAGFVSGEGSFSINTSIQAENKSVSLSFRVYQHIKDEELLKSFVNYFGLALACSLLLYPCCASLEVCTD